MARTKRREGPWCAWCQDEDGNWDTDCDEKFTFFEAGPRENKFCFCPYCGRVLRVKTAREPK